MATKWSLYERILRRWFTRYYIRRGIRRDEAANKQKLADKNLSADERQNLRDRLGHDMWEWYDWQRSLDDKNLMRRAKHVDIDLSEIARPEQTIAHRGLWRISEFGSDLLDDEVRKTLRKEVGERESARRKERRETLALLIGLFGVLVALVSVFKK